MEPTKEKKRCSASHILYKEKKRNLGKIPGVSTILKLKREMRFNVTRVAIHLDSELIHDEREANLC